MAGLIQVPGIERTSEAFRDKVVAIAADLEVDPNFLMAIMSFETAGTFDPAIRSGAGSGATGLIQFMPKTAKSLGTTTDALAQMTAEDQLDVVARYFQGFKGRMNTLEDAYMAVLFPAAIGKGSGHVLFRKGTVAFKQNRGLDRDGNGEITVGEAASKVRDRLGGAVIGGEPDDGELRRGNRGPEVEVLQHDLIDLGHLSVDKFNTGPGIFGPNTEAALEAFQEAVGLNPTGIYDGPSRAAIAQLNGGVAIGSMGGVVGPLQDRLIQLGLLAADVVAQAPGTFGPHTQNALITFQMGNNLSPNGILNDETYRVLFVGASAGPELSPLAEPLRLGGLSAGGIDTVLPERGPGFQAFNRSPGGTDQFGTLSTINAVLDLAATWRLAHPEVLLQIGDISLPGGAVFPPHKAHRKGNEIDMRPIRTDDAMAPTNVGSTSYDRARTTELVDMIRAKHPGVTIFFNDEALIDAGKTRRLKGHDNHLHVKLP